MMGASEKGSALPIRARPYRHQVEAFRYACALFGLPEWAAAQEQALLPLLPKLPKT